MQKILFILLTFVTAMAEAAPAGGHGDGIPAGTIFWQVFNLIIVGTILYFVTRKTVPAIFKQRQEEYLSSARKAEQARAEAERQYKDIKEKLERLSATYDESMARATAEATDMKKQLMAEAQELAQRIRTEAETTVRIELQKAKRELHEKFVQESVGLARQVLSRDIGSSDHQKLQSEFTRNIEAVNP